MGLGPSAAGTTSPMASVPSVKMMDLRADGWSAPAMALL